MQTDNTKFNGVIPLKKLQITYSRSTGPGGQNVNCVDTKCDVRFHVASADWLSESTRSAILEQYKTRITKDGYFVLKNDRTRYQQVNLADSLETIRNIIRELEKPKKELSAEMLAKIQARYAFQSLTILIFFLKTTYKNLKLILFSDKQKQQENVFE